MQGGARVACPPTPPLEELHPRPGLVPGKRQTVGPSWCLASGRVPTRALTTCCPSPLTPTPLPHAPPPLLHRPPVVHLPLSSRPSRWFSYKSSTPVMTLGASPPDPPHGLALEPCDAPTPFGDPAAIEVTHPARSRTTRPFHRGTATLRAVVEIRRWALAQSHSWIRRCRRGATRPHKVLHPGGSTGQRDPSIIVRTRPSSTPRNRRVATKPHPGRNEARRRPGGMVRSARARPH